jgi:hypothetical protein
VGGPATPRGFSPGKGVGQVVWIELRQGPAGPYGVRPRYRREDYVLPASELQSIVSERGGYLNVDGLIGERDGPFVGWTEVGRFERDGKCGVRLRQPDASWCVDVEVLPVGLGDVAAVDPLIAHDLARAADRTLPYPVIYE